ncbi:VanZ family protein [Arthrobacter stackebrandtii]|uniref:VanZ family protein n=1 Tax=Arthrobacter stackebrandtii TaxID=272161 RepID=UPI001AE482A9|nr:VanZ family protein [Arthrobacter stackebrandtii]
MAAIYGVAVIAIVFWPTPVDRPAAGGLKATLEWLHQHGLPQAIGYNQVEFSANVAMFIPMGIIAAAYFKNVLLGALAGAFASSLIELSQALFLPARYASGLDVVANTLGAAIGAAAYCLFVAAYTGRMTAGTPPLNAELSAPSDLQLDRSGVR